MGTRYSFKEYLQDQALARSRRPIRALLNLKADYANLKLNGKEIL